MADWMQKLSDAFLRLKYPSSRSAPALLNPPPFAAQDRYLQTPIVYNNYQTGVLGAYEPNGNPGAELKNAISSGRQLDPETLRALDSVVKEWNSNSGYINMNPLYMSSNPEGSRETLMHELTHKIYDKAGLKDRSFDLLNSMSPAARENILNSPTYNTMPKPFAGSPEQVTDEGLAYANKSMDADLINKAAAMIADPKLRKVLLKIKGMGGEGK